MTFSTISNRGINSRRPVGEPGTPRDLTISDDHLLTPATPCTVDKPPRPQRIQRENRSHKRGLRSEAALLQRKCNQQATRRLHRRNYRWCKTNMRGVADDMYQDWLGTNPVPSAKTTQASRSLKDARSSTSTRLYEEHHNHTKPDLNRFKLPYACKLKVVSLNVRSLIKPTMHQQIVTYMKEHRIQVLCLQETKSKTTTQYLVDNFTFMTISTASSQQQEHAGVGFVLSPEARSALLRTTCIHSRLATITLLLASGEFTIVNTHVPHSGRPEEERQAHFDELQQLVERVQNKGPFIVIGDMNSRLQGRLVGEDDVLGPHLFGKGPQGIGDETENRFLLVDFCKTNSLIVANTWFKHPPGKQVTYKEPHTKVLPDNNCDWSPQDFAQLDLCLIPQRWRNACTDICSQPRANLDSDHFPVKVCMRVKLGAKAKPARYAKWDFNGATKETIASMNKDIEDGIANENLKEGRPTDIWHKLSSAYLQAIERNIPKISSRPRKPWITQSTLDLLEERGRLRQQGDMTKVAELNRDIRKAAKRDKRNWLDGQLQTGDWGPITNLRKPFRTQVLALRRNDQTTHTATNADIYASHLANEQWKEAGMPEGLSDTPVLNAPPTISESTISMEELLLAIKQSKSGKRGGKDRLPNEFWKSLRGAGLEELLSFFKQCWDSEGSPEQWKLAQVVGVFKKGAADDPANYRPISLLQTCYKLYARIIANRLSAGLDSHIRELQYGFRQGRSTSEAIYLVRRLQDLVDAKKHQVLYLMFLDWSKAFDRIRPVALFLALRRLGVPAHMCAVVQELVSNPLFEVIMGEDISACKHQRSGIRQGCTLSPLLFILLQTVLFHDVQQQYLRKHPLANTPRLPFFDVEFADDTVLIARTQEQMQDLLLIVQEEAAKYNLHLNLDKTKLILYNSEGKIFFSNGDPVPRVSSIVYLGGLVEETGRPGPEVRRRIGEARTVFQSLKRVWKHAGLSTKKKLQIYKSCVVSKLLYNMSTLWLTETQLNSIDAFHYKCLRSIANIPTTWGAMQIGVARTSNEAVRAKLNETLLSDEVRLHQLKLLGHILRRPQDHPARIVSFDRFLEPQMWGGPFRSGRRRHKWTEEVLGLAMTICNDHFYEGRGNHKTVKLRLLEVASDRKGWSELLGFTRQSWRRQRDACSAQGS